MKTIELSKAEYIKNGDKVIIASTINIDNFKTESFNRIYDKNLNAAARLQPVTMSISFDAINDESYSQQSENLEATHQFYTHSCPKFDDEHSDKVSEEEALNANINEDKVYFINEE